jgi:hypothetical protein
MLSFKVCKSLHHRKNQINHQPDATIFQFIILTFIYSSTRFGRSPAYYQELNDYSSSFWFYLRTTNTARLSPQHEGKTKGCYCSHWAPDDGWEKPETCSAVNKRQDNKLENCCIWVVIYLNWCFAWLLLCLQRQYSNIRYQHYSNTLASL